MDITRRYDYNLPWRAVTVGAVLYAGLSVLMAHLAKGATGIIFVSWVTLSAMFAALAFFVVARRLVLRRVLELAGDAILFPHGVFQTRITRVPYADIIRMSEIKFHGWDGLYLRTATGSFEIGASRFRDIQSYHAVKDFICSQIPVALPRGNNREPSAWMTGGFPQPILGWVEPEDWPRYRTHLVVSKPLLPRLARALWFFIRCFGIILLPWLLLRLFLGSDLPAASYLWLSIAVSFFFTSLHWLNAAYPARATKITFRDHGITQLSGKQVRDLNYCDCPGWAVVERQFEGRVLHILLLRWRTYVVEVALPDVDTRDRLIRLFHDKQIPQSPDLKPSWE